MVDSASERQATPEAGLSAEEFQAVPPMLNDLACRQCTTKSAFNTHGDAARGRLCSLVHFAKAALQCCSGHPTHAPLGLVRTKNGTAAAGSSNNAQAAHRFACTCNA